MTPADVDSGRTRQRATGAVVGASYVNPITGYISAVGVSAAFRGRGLGKLLVVAGVEQIEVEARIFV